MSRAMAGGVGRSGTIKGSLRYNVKVAVHLKRGVGAAEEYAVTSAALQRKLEKQKSRSRERLRDRVRLRFHTGLAVGTAASAQHVSAEGAKGKPKVFMTK